nr:integrase family protein [Burkholderia contaminans]
MRRDSDATLTWVVEFYPELAAWRGFALEWLGGETHGLHQRLQALSTFFERYLILQSLPLDPSVFLAQTTQVPEFHRTACPDSPWGISANNLIHAFLQFVLLRHFSQIGKNDNAVLMQGYHNPVRRMSKAGLPKRGESVYSPLPYGYIDQLRQMLAAGPHFRDWQWAHGALGSKIGHMGASAPDWLDVTEDEIDRDDPDCVWRIRKLSRNYRGGQVLQMWSPVRWVALLVKLILPLRTSQVRVLDSGEADTWRYAAGRWERNSSEIAEGSESRPLQQGVFRRDYDRNNNENALAILYINTNKTADVSKSGPEKGYLLPWTHGGRFTRMFSTGSRSCATGKRSTTPSRVGPHGQNLIVDISLPRLIFSWRAILTRAFSSDCQNIQRHECVTFRFRIRRSIRAGSIC